MIGRRCKHGNVFSRPVLIGRGLGARARYGRLTGAAVTPALTPDLFAADAATPTPRHGSRDAMPGSEMRRKAERFPVTIAAGSHPFPSRTRKLSLPAPMVLGGRPSGRVGRCRNLSQRQPHALGAWGCFALGGASKKLLRSSAATGTRSTTRSSQCGSADLSGVECS